MRIRKLLMIVAALLIATDACGAVKANTNGFVVRHEVAIRAAPAKVYEMLLGQVGAWWDAAHTYSGDSKNLSIDAQPGGCFCERFPAGGGIEHMRVLYVAPAHVVRMSGALGPLQSSGLNGAMTWELSGDKSETKLVLTYSVGGFMDGGFEQIAPAVEGMLGEQVQRLKRFVETGSAAVK